MGCGGNANARTVEMPKTLTIHGNVLDSQTRALMAICELSGTAYIPNKIDNLKGENTQSRYLAINPTGHIPMLEDGMFKVLGGNHIIFVYLSKAKSAIAAKLMQPDMELKIKGILGWYQAKMSVPSQQLFRMMYQPTAFNAKPTSV